jgi:hypothetical protein
MYIYLISQDGFIIIGIHRVFGLIIQAFFWEKSFNTVIGIHWVSGYIILAFLENGFSIVIGIYQVHPARLSYPTFFETPNYLESSIVHAKFFDDVTEAVTELNHALELISRIFREKK